MIDLNRLREHPEQVRTLLAKKEPKYDVAALIAKDKELREKRTQVEDLRKERNALSAQAAKGLTEELRARSSDIGKKIKELEVDLVLLEKEFNDHALASPNIPQEDLPEGGKEANKVVRTISQKPEFSFPYKNHVELNQKLGWFDFEKAAAMSGAQFVLYREMGTKLVYGLTRLMIKNNVKHGFEPIIPPALVTEQALYNSGNLPKFRGDFYEIPADGLCVIPTAEVPLTNIYANHIFAADELPRRMTAWTSCFRREAGGYGSLERGLIRVHQFEKVELYSITKPEDSDAELERMVACAEALLKDLGLHYQVSLLAAQDCSFASARTYDIEVWLPGQDRYYEVSSCSNCTDFQARRAGIRYRETAESKPKLAHTLNASSIALSRLTVALMENYQQPDGTIKFPKILEDAMNELW